MNLYKLYNHKSQILESKHVHVRCISFHFMHYFLISK